MQIYYIDETNRTWVHGFICKNIGLFYKSHIGAWVYFTNRTWAHMDAYK